MTTPNPSRSVSPEPTKGEGNMEVLGVAESRRRLIAMVRSDDMASMAIIEDLDGFAIAMTAFEQAIASTYIPLVEAAEAAIEIYDRDGEVMFDSLRAALVQVPGQQQADTVGGAAPSAVVGCEHCLDRHEIEVFNWIDGKWHRFECLYCTTTDMPVNIGYSGTPTRPATESTGDSADQ